MATINRNIPFPIYDANGNSFYGLTLRKATVEKQVMSLGYKISGDVYHKSDRLSFSMREYVEYEGVKWVLVNPPAKVKEAMTSDNGELKGMTKYTLEFYHPMYVLTNIPFTDVAVSFDELRYKSSDKSFAWIGYLEDYVNKLNKNLENTEWIVEMSDTLPLEVTTKLSEVLTFDNQMISDALKTGYDTWEIPFVISPINEGEEHYDEGKRFLVQYGLPTKEIFASDEDKANNNPFVFRMGQGVGLKNNSATPKNNKIVTRLYGYGSEDNIPFGYPQILWDGNPTWEYTIDNDSTNPLSYPIYEGIVGGEWVKLIKHPFTRKHLMPSIYEQTVNRKVNPLNALYDPDIEIIDYYDADESFANRVNPLAPSCEIHQFEDIKPELGERNILDAKPINTQTLEVESKWDDTLDLETEEYVQSYFQITLPQLDFDLYACAAITQEMQINMRGGACIGCTFNVQVDWDDYKLNFYDREGNFKPEGNQRDYTKYPDSSKGAITIILQKETETFGTLMPNRFQHPKSGDQFVILGISLPLSYVKNAQERLDKESKAWMKDNNVYYFEYPLKFDEFFLTQNPHILSQIHNNVLIYFEYESTILSLYVKQITIKYGEGVLPTYDITLTDDIEVTINQIGQTVEEVSKIDTILDNLRSDVEEAQLPQLLTRSKRDHSVVNYLKQALNQDSEVIGGLLLTTIIALRDENNDIWSGINGAYDGTQSSGGIAAWFGGPMVDYVVNPTAEEFAKIVFRFDGSGYVAGGNIRWDTLGNAAFNGEVVATSGSIGGFEIAQGRIGTSRTLDNYKNELCITEDFINVGTEKSWVYIGHNGKQAGLPSTASATINNHHDNSSITNIGIDISVDGGGHNYGVLSDAPIRATSVYGTELVFVPFTSSQPFTLDFDAHNVFYFKAQTTINSVTLSKKTNVASRLGYGTLPTNFCYVFTIIMYTDSENITLTSVAHASSDNQNGAPIDIYNHYGNLTLKKGDVAVFAIVNDPEFKYKLLYHTQGVR